MPSSDPDEGMGYSWGENDMARWFEFLAGTRSLQRKMLIIFICVSIPLFALLYSVQHVSQNMILDHIDEIDAIRMAETSNNIRDMLNRLFMSTNLFISDSSFIDALEIEDPFDINKINTYFNTIDRLQYTFFLNHQYTVAVIDKHGNDYIFDAARMSLSKEAIREMLKEQIPQESMSIMDSYRWYLLDMTTTRGETERFLVLYRIVFKPETAVAKGKVFMIMPFSYIEMILERQQGYIDITAPDAGAIYRTEEREGMNVDDRPEVYSLEPTDWEMHYWRDRDVVSEKMALFRMTTYIAFGVTIILMIGVAFIVISEIRKALLQIRSLSRQLMVNHISDVSLDSDYHIIELSQSLQQLVHNLNTARRNYELAANEKRQLEMQMLQHQINPHFLLNTLSTFRWLADSAGLGRLSSLIVALSHMLRQQLYDNRPYWTVEEEFAYINRYIEIQQARFGNNIAVFIRIEPGTEQAPLLKMLIQPIIENCFEHAFVDRGRGTIRIVVLRVPRGLSIVIEDDGCGMTSTSSPRPKAQGRSIGLENVRSRIALHYGGASRLEIGTPASGGTRVTLVLEGKEGNSYEEATADCG